MTKPLNAPPRTLPPAWRPSSVAAPPAPPPTRAVPALRPPASSARRPAPATSPSSAPWPVALAVAVVGVFLSGLDGAVLGAALPVIGQDLHVNSLDLSRVNTGFRVSEAILVPATAWLTARIGARRLYLASLALFTVCSLLCALAWNLDSLIAFRMLQAVPGSVTPVVSLAIIFRTVPPARLGPALSLYGLGIVSAPGLAPLISGLLVEHGAWRTVFLLDAPLALVGLLAGLVVLPAMPGDRGRRFDPVGFLAAGLGLSALVVACYQAPQWGWTSYPVLLLGTGGLLTLALFVVVELEVEHPLLDLTTFTRRPFLALVVLIDVLFTGVFVVMGYVPQFLAQAEQLSPLDTGLLLVPQALVWMALMPVAGLLYGRWGARWPVVVGLVVTAVGTLALAGLTVDTSRLELAAWLCVRSVGLGLAFVPLLAGGMSALPPSLVNDGSALRTLAQWITATLGLALLTALQLHQQAQLFSDRAALLPAGGPDPRLPSPADHTALVGLWRQVSARVAIESYTEVFLITGGLTLLAALLAVFLLPGGRPRR